MLTNTQIVNPPLSIPQTAYAAGVPTGARTVDHYDLDDGDASHPISIDYLVPFASTVTKATISWRLRAFRSTANINPSSVGTDATAESGHSHSHNHGGHTHSVHVLGASGQVATLVGNGSGAAWGDNSQVSAYDTSQIVNSTTPATDSTGSSGHTHSHSHSLSGSGAQSVTDGPVSTITNISFDGVDQTSALGGPWSRGAIWSS